MTVDVAIVGAGTGGAAAALQCARRGLSVVCLDSQPVQASGARWVNGVPVSAFEQAGLDQPVGPERLGGGQAFHLIVGWGPDRLSLPAHCVLEVDMRHLVRRLQEGATAAGAEFRGEVEVEGDGFDPDSGQIPTSEGPLAARFFVDASGLTGARLLGQPRVTKEHLCVAAQQVRDADPAGAAEFYAQQGLPVGDTVCFTGISGGFSIVNVRAHGDSVALLTGGIPGLGFDSGVHLLREFAAKQAWIGDIRFGGARAVPLRRPHDRIAAGAVAAIGDAACQVFPAHGSGIGGQLVAARMLGEALSAGGSRPAERYGVGWMRRHGGLFAAYDLFRRFSQTLTVEEIGRLMRSGLMDAHSATAALEQRLPGPSLSAIATLPRKAWALLRNRDLAVRLVGMGGRIARVLPHYRRYPSDPAALAKWASIAARIFEEEVVL